MKQKVLYILLILFACAWNTQAWGQTTCYALSKQGEKLVKDQDVIYNIDGAGQTLTFKCKKYNGLVTSSKKLSIYGYSGENATGTQTLIKEISGLSTSYEEKSYSIDPTYKSIKFTTNANYGMYINEVAIIRATTLTSSTTSLDLGEIQPNKSISSSISVSYNNTYNPTTLSGTCTNNAFQIESISLGEKGDASVKVTFTPTAVGEYNGTVTLTMGSATYQFNVSGKCTIQKVDPTFTWGNSNVFTNQDYPDFFQTTNKDCPYTITSSDESKAKITTDGTLHVYGVTGSVTFTAHQNGNDNEWKEKTDTYTINIVEPQNHLPCNLSEENYQHYRFYNEGKCTWNGGVALGNTNLEPGNWDDKYFDIHFEGIPKDISFSYECSQGLATGVDWRIYESSDGVNWGNPIWSSESNSGNVSETAMKPETRYVRLLYSGNYGGYFKNVVITELKYFNIGKESIDFGTILKGSTVSPQTIVLSHCNASGMTNISVDDETNFSVSPTTLNTGGDRMGDETITVTYKNNTVGTHNAKVTISDGTNTKVVNVTGTTQTVYYARGNATATEGGSAYVSASSFDEATSASVNKTSEATSETSAKTTLYYKAAPNQYYKFLGWKNSQSDETFVSNETNYAINNFVYNSEDVNNPTTYALFAIFEPKTITLDPADVSSLLADDYKTVTFNRTLKQGYNTLALPFDTDVEALTGRKNNDDWVAQLALVTHNEQDGYTLYFTKVEDGVITANQPYILYLGDAVVNPSWTNMTVVAAESKSVSAEKNYDWTMKSNYTPTFPMSGKYGIVNSDGNIQKGASGSTLNAFSAYIEGPANSQVKAAFLDDATAIEEILQQADEDTVIKRIENGKLVILQGDKKYNASGVRLK